MSTKKEAERSSTVYDDKTELRTGLSEQGHAVDRALDETRNNIRRTVDEAKRVIPRNTQVINDYQEHTLQASKEIADQLPRISKGDYTIISVGMGSVY